MIILGGTYREECVLPQWSRIFGSGGRAAVAVSIQSPDTVLYTYAARNWAGDVRASMEALGIAVAIVEIDDDICFSYFHPLSNPQRQPSSLQRQRPLKATGDALLRFGFVEGDAVVDGERVVYDPQHWSEALLFGSNGSKARDLAIVLNEAELKLSTGQADESQAVEALRRQTGAAVVVVKRGPRGVAVYDADHRSLLSAYLSDTIFKIGSGDIFSAVFALQWAERKASAIDAARTASQAVSYYVSSRSAQLPSMIDFTPEPAPFKDQIGTIYLASPFFSLGQRWVVEESLKALEGLGATVFSPLHEVGIGRSSDDIAHLDLAGLERAKAVFAILDGSDPGTLFEIGYARARGIPVVALSEMSREEDLTMVIGSGCKVYADFTTAIYHAVWAAML